MSVPLANSADSTGSQGVSSGQPQTEQKASNSMMSFLYPGFRICKQAKSEQCTYSSEHSSACYHHTGTGNIIHSQNKIYILTVAHLFSATTEEYLLHSTNLSIPFSYARENTSAAEQNDIALIPIGEIDPETNNLIFKTNSTFHGKLHIHN